MPKVTFKEPVWAVNCQRGQRVQVKVGHPYELTEIKASRSGEADIVSFTGDETYQGGDSGQQELPCDLKVQVKRGVAAVQ